MEARPEDPPAKEAREQEGERLKTKEAGRATVRRGRLEEREGDLLFKPQGPRWVRGRGRLSGSFHLLPYDSHHSFAWYVPERPRLGPFAPRDDFQPDTESCLACDLRETLERLSPDEQRRFRAKVREVPLHPGFARISKAALEEADASRLRDLLITYYGAYAAEVAAKALRAAYCADKADQRLLLAGEGYWAGINAYLRKKKVWSLGEVAVTGDEMVCKGRKELLEIVEMGISFFLHFTCNAYIITQKEYRDLLMRVPKEKSGKLLDLIQEKGDATCCCFLELVERLYPGSIEILLAAVQGSDKKMGQATSSSVLQSESSLFVEEGGRSKMGNPTACGENLKCNLCPCEDLAETIRPEVFLDSETSHEKYRLCFTEAGSFLCLYTDVIFEVRGAVTITYHFDSWPKHLVEQNMENWIVAGPLINIEAAPAEAVAAVHFPHFLCLAGKDGSEVYIAHFVEGGMSLEKPDRVGPYRVVLENPDFSPRGAILRTSWLKRKIRVHTVALLYQMVRFQPPTFHLYLLPNDASVRKAVHEHEVQCPSQRIEKPPWTLRPLKIGCRFFVETNDTRICPKEVEFQYLDADKLQQYVELSAEQMQDTFNFSVMEKRKNELIWEALVTQKDLMSLEMMTSLPHSEQGLSSPKSGEKVMVPYGPKAAWCPACCCCHWHHYCSYGCLCCSCSRCRPCCGSHGCCCCSQ